jgi:Tfp pilus assembly protein PilV
MSRFATSRVRSAVGAGARQRGYFLLEALIAVFIVALAILGLIGLMARSIQNVDESKFRGEAAALTSAFVGNMWIDDRTLASLQAKYKSPGAGYVELQNLADQRLPNAAAPVVDIVAGQTPNSADVTVTLQWQPPGEHDPHVYRTFATIGANN